MAVNSGEEFARRKAGFSPSYFLVVCKRDTEYYGKVVKTTEISEDAETITVEIIGDGETVTLPADHFLHPFGPHWKEIKSEVGL